MRLAVVVVLMCLTVAPPALPGTTGGDPQRASSAEKVVVHAASDGSAIGHTPQLTEDLDRPWVAVPKLTPCVQTYHFLEPCYKCNAAKLCVPGVPSGGESCIDGDGTCTLLGVCGTGKMEPLP